MVQVSDRGFVGHVVGQVGVRIRIPGSTSERSPLTIDTLSAIPRLALTTQRIVVDGPGNFLSLLRLARLVDWSGTR